MKKMMVAAFIILILFLSIPVLGAQQQLPENDYQVIPDEAIRLRILANSDKEEDQELKRLVRDRVNQTVTDWVENITEVEEARALISSRVPQLEELVAQVIEEEGDENAFHVEYGENVTFPMKLYGTYLYPAGEYEAILITLGEGKGDNWWCVLFPPLCFLDFFNGTSVAQVDGEPEETEVKFFLFEWLGWS